MIPGEECVMRNFIVCIALICMIAGTAFSATGPAEEEWELSGISKIKIKGVSGDVIILPAEDREGRVELRSRIRPKDSFTPQVKRSGGTLHIKEKFHGSSNGSVEWTLYLPEAKKPIK